jgi:uncharacterized protein YyaL (SSP411 family)
MGKAMLSYPTSFGVWALCLQNMVHGQIEIAVLGQRARRLLPLLLKKYVPNKILQVAETNLDVFPLLNGKRIPDLMDETAFYLCRNYACSKPFTKIEELLANV